MNSLLAFLSLLLASCATGSGPASPVDIHPDADALAVDSGSDFLLPDPGKGPGDPESDLVQDQAQKPAQDSAPSLPETVWPDVPVDAPPVSDEGAAGETASTLSIVSISPDHGPASGMNTVTLTGEGFTEDAEVFFGDTKALYPFVLSSTLLNCTAPPRDAGIVTVRVLLPDGKAAEKVDAYRFEADLTAVSVSPASGPSSGGTPVTVKGSGFLGSPTFLFGGRVAVSVKVVDDWTALLITPPHSPGPVSLIVVAGDRKARLPEAFTYQKETLPPASLGLSVVSVSPPTGPAAGGTDIVVEGTGFVPGASVRVGSLPASGVFVESPTRLHARTPPGSPGPVDVAVFASGAAAVLPDGFEYDGGGPTVLAAEPDMAAWTGGTWVRLYGVGLSGVTDVRFGEMAARQVLVRSAIEVAAVTPRVEVAGTVPVRAIADGGSFGESPFLFFDPSLKGGGTWGGPVAGALNVTVMSGQNAKPLPDAFVILGADSHGKFKGRTDDRGQITFSDFGLMGPLTFHATREGFSASTLADFDAVNATVYLYPPPSPEGPGQPPNSGTQTCTVRGIVKDYGKYFLKPPGMDGTFSVSCWTTAPSMFGGGTDPGPKAVVDQHGRFEIITRTGEFGVGCSLMVLETGAWWPHPVKIGLTPHVKCAEAGSIVEGVEVQITTPTDAELWLATGPLPSWSTGTVGPTLIGSWEVGTDGFLDIVKNPETVGPLRLRIPWQPRDFAGPLAGYGYSFYTIASSVSDIGLPYGVTLRTGVSFPQSWPWLVGEDTGLLEFPTPQRRPVTALRPVKEGAILAADSGGGTYFWDGKGLYLAQVQTYRAIRGLWGDSLTRFWAVGDGGAIWRIQNADAEKLDPGVPGVPSFFGIDGDSDTDLHVVGGSWLLHWDGTMFRQETVPQDIDLTGVKRTPGGGVAAIGKKGALVLGVTGGGFEVLAPTSEDLTGIDGPGPDDLWISATGGQLLHLSGTEVSIMLTPNGKDLHGVLYRGPCDVFVFGDEGTLYRFDCHGFEDLSRPDADMDLLAGALFGDVPVFAGRRYIRLPDFLAFPSILAPAEAAAWDGRAVEWFYPPDQDFSFHQAQLSNAMGQTFWVVTCAGWTRSVALPDFPDLIGYTPIPVGTKRMNLTSVQTPGFSIDGFNANDFNFYKRRAFSVGLVTFQ